MWVSNFVINQKSTPAIISDLYANIPLPGIQYRLFVAIDTFLIYQDNGTSWNVLGGINGINPISTTVTTDGATVNVPAIIGKTAVLIAARGTAVIDNIIYTGTPTGNSLLVNLTTGNVTAPDDQPFITDENLLIVVR